ncbi:MAG: hypothetical protein GY782_08600 [Gammaproteobacteria bacterium]|nr:hypothetical protein [Gammaproteobacteria bacterium]
MIIEKIEESLIRKGSRERKAHYPSDINSCQRQLTYKWLAKEASNPIPPSGYLKMEMGNAIHELVPVWLANVGLEIIDEFANKKAIEGLKYPFSYRIDNLFMEHDEISGIEVKTSYGIGIKQIQVKGQPKESDIKQVLTYMELEPSIHKFYLVYIGRDNGYRTEFIIPRIINTAVLYGVRWNWDDEIKRLKGIEIAIEANTLLPRDYNICRVNGEFKDKFTANKIEYKSDWQCSYCSWRSDCWPMDLCKYGKFYGFQKIV